MTHQPTSAIDEILRKSRILHNDAAKRHSLALRIQITGKSFSESTCDRMTRHFESLGGDGYSQTCSALADGAWMELDRDLAEEEADAKREHKESREGSAMKFVSADNPYGWADEEHHKFLDHDTPGEWNGYRQCFNMTTAQRDAIAAKDHRYRGCTRYEVMGHTEGFGAWRPGMPKMTAEPATPTVHHDLARVELAKGRDYGTPNGIGQ